MKTRMLQGLFGRVNPPINPIVPSLFSFVFPDLFEQQFWLLPGKISVLRERFCFLPVHTGEILIVRADFPLAGFIIL